MASPGPAIVARLAARGARAALVDAHGAYTYGALAAGAARVAAELRTRLPVSVSSEQSRIAYYCARDNTYVQSQLAAWHSGSVGVPLAENYPASELEYVLRDSGASAVLTVAGAQSALVGPVAASLGIPCVEVPRLPPCGTTLSAVRAAAAGAGSGPTLAPGSVGPGGVGAIIIYTSGTTGRPKGVLTSHAALAAQVGAMTSAWAWSEDDHIYGVLPLHHVHGVVAILNAALWSGAVAELAPRFSAGDTWAALTRPRGAPNGAPSLFMAVPTVYAKLLEHYDAQAPAVAEALRGGVRAPASSARLMVSGSAALPAPIAERWAALTGHPLLERYGMTEFAMALSNPLDVAARKANSVGLPLPGYEARLVDEAGGGDGAGAPPAAPPADGFVARGELHIRGPGVFSCYWGRPEATAETFSPDGWFKTGDYAGRDAAGCYSILGRLSADIIKSGGYKISALDIERVLLAHPRIAEVAVLGLPDDAYGERVAAVIVPRAEPPAAGDDAAATAAAAAALAEPAALAAFAADLKVFCKDKMAPYKTPSVLRVVPSIARNAMGKINKKALRVELWGSTALPAVA